MHRLFLMAVAMAGFACAADGLSVPLPLYSDSALSSTRRETLRRELPHAITAARSELSVHTAELTAAFAGAGDAFQARRASKRIEMAVRLEKFLAREAGRGDVSGLLRAEIALDELREFNAAFAQDMAAWRTYPLNPSVAPVHLSLVRFGAVGDGVADASGALLAAAESIRALRGAPCVLDIPPGTYLIRSAGNPRVPHLVLAGLTNCVISGSSPESTHLVLDSYEGKGIQFRKAYNSTLRNVQVYLRESPFVQGVVEEVGKDEGWLVMRHLPETLRPDDPRFKARKHPNSCVQFDSDGHPVRKPVLWFDYRAEDMGGGLFRMRFSSEHASTRTMPVTPGTTFVFPDRDNTMPLLQCEGSDRFTFENVWVRNSRSGAFSPGICRYPTLVGCRIFPRKGAGGTLALSTNADGFYCPPGATIMDCDFTNMNDDGCNSHDTGRLPLTPTPSGDGFEHVPFWQGTRRGALMLAVNSFTGQYLANLRVASAACEWRGTRTIQTTRFAEAPVGIASYASLEIPEYTPLQRRAIFLGTTVPEKYPDQIYLPNMAGVGFVCSGNRFANLRGVAVQVQCSSALVESNVVEHVYRGIELSGLLHYQEGPPPCNVVIRGNAIRHVNRGIKSSVMTVAKHLAPALTAPISDIQISENRLEDVGEVAFNLANVSDASLEGNSVNGHPTGPSDVRLCVCANVWLDGNAIGLARGATASEVVFEAPQRLAFGGVGFQNAEAQIAVLMPDDFRDQRVLKSFREISPTFSRVYAGFAACPREQADRFADYYDATFRTAGTELYAVGGMMPFVPEDETEAYAEKVAANLEYLIKMRGCTNIRHYCMTNELGIDGQGDWYFNRMERFRQIHAALRAAFDRHGLQDVGLAATDVNQHVRLSLSQLDWATKNMDDITSIYCTHWYMFLGQTKDGKSILPSSPENAATMRTHFSSLVAKAAEKGKRYFVGEFGLWTPSTQGANRIMHDDTGYPLRAPEHAADGASTLAEIALTAMNEGAYAAASWSFVDYPDPFVFEPGDTPEEDAVYQSARCVYWPDRKYNKWGMFRWDSVDRDYGAYPSLYTMGWMAKLFRRGARVVKSRVSDDTLRACGVTNPDGSASFAVINWGEAKTVSLVLPQPLARPLRVYEYDSARPPTNAFNDLQPAKGTVVANGGVVTLSVPAKSMTFLTTDYKDRVPAAVVGVRIEDGMLRWTTSAEPEHCYYRVYRDGKQIASTVATSLSAPGMTPGDVKRFAVKSVDKWGNEGRCAAGRRSDTIKRQHAKGR